MSQQPEQALVALASDLRADGSVISPHVVDPESFPALGVLVAGGPRTRQAPAAYARVIESVREGYLLHYSEPRVVAPDDADLALLAGDYLYASGLSLLAGMGDARSVSELADLIALCAQAHTDGAADVPALWLAATVAIAAGSGKAHVAAKSAASRGIRVSRELWQWSSQVAAQAGLDEELGAAAEAVGFAR